MDMDDNEELTLEEFVANIQNPTIFQLLDSNRDSLVTYSEIFTSAQSLRQKLENLNRQLENSEPERIDSTADRDQTSSPKAEDSDIMADPGLQEKLKELYKYIMKGNEKPS